MNLRGGGKCVVIYFDDISYTTGRSTDVEPVRHKQEFTRVGLGILDATDGLAGRTLAGRTVRSFPSHLKSKGKSKGSRFFSERLIDKRSHLDNLGHPQSTRIHVAGDHPHRQGWIFAVVSFKTQVAALSAKIAAESALI